MHLTMSALWLSRLSATRRYRRQKHHTDDERQVSLARGLQIGYNHGMKVLLTTLHAKYVHASLALPCLAAACRDLKGVDTVIREFTLNETPDRLLRNLLAEEADLVAFSCYIWNIETTLRLATDLKLLRPQTFIVLGRHTYAGAWGRNKKEAEQRAARNALSELNGEVAPFPSD